MTEPRTIKRMAPTFISSEVGLPLPQIKNSKTTGQTREADLLKNSNVNGRILAKEEKKGNKIIDHY